MPETKAQRKRLQNIKGIKMYEITVTGDIASAHFLRGYEGKCKNLHGHTWKVEVTMEGKQLDEVGMVTDFAILKEQLKEILSEIDHVCLNDLDYFKEVNPTTENIAGYIYGEYKQIGPPLKVKRVRVWESDRNSAIYYE